VFVAEPEELMMVTAEDIRRVAMDLPRTTEGLVRERIKFRVGSIVYISIAGDESAMGFGYPKEERDALIASDPEKFFMPIKSDERYNWVRAWMGALDQDEMRELVIDAWCMCVPKKVSSAYLASLALPGAP
jgi:hypothetical protein